MKKSVLFLISVVIIFSSCEVRALVSSVQFFEGKEDLKLSELTIVGAHNAYNWDGSGFHKPNQNWSIVAQLNFHGVRFLEIDVHKFVDVDELIDVHEVKRKLVAAHGLQNSGCVPAGCAMIDLDDVLGWFKDFLDDNPGELLIIYWEYHSDRAVCGVNWSEIEDALKNANLDDHIYHTINGMADPTVQQLIDADTRLIFRNHSGLRRKTNGGSVEKFYSLEKFDKVNYTDYANPARLHVLTPIAQSGFKQAYGDEKQAIITNKADYLVRYIQRAWLYNGQRPTIISCDFVDKGDVFGAVNQVMDYNVYKGSIRNYPSSSPTIYWTLKYTNQTYTLTKVGMSGEFFDFPGEIDYMGTIYTLRSITPAAFSGSVTLNSDTLSSRGGVTYNDMVYSYNSGGSPLLTGFSDGDYYLKNLYLGKYLTVRSTADKADLIPAFNGCHSYQKWTFTKHSNGYYYIKSVYSGKYANLSNPKGSTSSLYDSYFGRNFTTEKGHVENAKIVQFGTDASNINNEWFILPLSDGSRKCMIVSRESGRVMTFPSEDDNVGLVANEMGPHGQIWQIETASKCEPDPRFAGWVKVEGKFIDISVAEDGSVWVVDSTNEIYRRMNVDSIWEKVPSPSIRIMSIVQLSHRSFNGEVWGVNNDSEIFRRKGEEWKKVDGLLKHVSVAADGTVWGVNRENEIYRRKDDDSKWEKVSGLLKNVSVAADGIVCGVNSKNVTYRRKDDNSAWERIPGAFKQVCMTAEGTLWGVNCNGEILRSKAMGWDWENMAPYDPVIYKQVSVGSSSNLWALDKDGYIYYYDGDNSLKSEEVANSISDPVNGITLENDLADPIEVASDKTREFSVRVYPNPVSSFLTIEVANAPAGDILCSLFNAYGHLVARKNISSGTIQLNVFGFPKGLYTVVITVDGVKSVEKLMID